MSPTTMLVIGCVLGAIGFVGLIGIVIAGPKKQPHNRRWTDQ